LRTRLRRKAIASSSSWQRQQDVLDSRSSAGSDPEPNADAREAVRRLQALLDNLKPLYRIAFVSFELDGKSLREVAARTGSSLPATKSRIIRARRRIAKVARTDELLGEYIANSRRWTGAGAAALRSSAGADAIESVGARTRPRPHRAR
jgi:DNA-directed RNA polymerase specialized sigma24 family protein